MNSPSCSGSGSDSDSGSDSESDLSIASLPSVANQDDYAADESSDDSFCTLDSASIADFDVNDAGTLTAHVERQLEASIFQVEPVTHITYQLLYVDNSRQLERVERHVMRLRVPNVVDRFDVGRIIKAARYGRDTARQAVLYRLESLFVYNIDVTLGELGSLLLPPADRFITVLSSLSNFTLRPTMACFHSANSIHIVLSRIRNSATASATAAAADTIQPKRRIVITPAASTRRRRAR